MNRQQRRAAMKSSAGRSAAAAPETPEQIFAKAVELARSGDRQTAVKTYRQFLSLQPNHSQAWNNLGCLFRDMGQLKEASECFARVLWLDPVQFEQIVAIFETLFSVLPQLRQATNEAATAWPRRLTETELFGTPSLSAIAGDPTLLCLMKSIPARAVAFERLLTSLRLSLLNSASAGEAFPDSRLAFCCTLAEQCFINEYVFAATPDEAERAEALKNKLIAALASGAAVEASVAAAVAMYFPLHKLANAQAFDRPWPPALSGLIVQQVHEPAEELRLRDTIPRLTPIEDDVSKLVQQQYEENPYPRWVNGNWTAPSIAIDLQVRNKFPTIPFTPIGKTENLDVLVPGCGTGLAISVAQIYQGARVLAMDLSLSSLSYSKRKTPPQIADRIEYFQGDILKLGTIGRTFDFIEVTGVLHHMRDPFEGWRILLSLLRPGGLMHVAFYSEMARQDVAAGRAFVAERSYPSTPEGIRQCRQDMLNTPLGSLTRFTDFFATSEFRDLVFHVQESRMTLPVIKSFLKEQGLRFIGFDLRDSEAQKFRDIFAESGWSLTNLDRWHEMEVAFPNTFANMYQFWVQKD